MHDHDDDQERAAFSVEGVDLTLIDWLLQLTPAERLQVLQSSNQSLEALRGAAAQR